MLYWRRSLTFPKSVERLRKSATVLTRKTLQRTTYISKSFLNILAANGKKYNIWPKGMKTNVLTKTMRHQEQQQAGLSLTGEALRSNNAPWEASAKVALDKVALDKVALLPKHRKFAGKAARSHTRNVFQANNRNYRINMKTTQPSFQAACKTISLHGRP